MTVYSKYLKKAKASPKNAPFGPKDNQPVGAWKQSRVLSSLIALLWLCPFVRVAAPLVEICKLSLNGAVGPGGTAKAVPPSFYFSKGQWLADARTVAQAVRYLLEPEPARKSAVAACFASKARGLPFSKPGPIC